MSDADVYRSTPGRVYGVASRHSGPGVPVPDKPGWFTAGPADYYFITKGNTLSDELQEHFPTPEAAKARAGELNVRAGELNVRDVRDVIKDRRLTKKEEKRARALHELSGPSWLSQDAFSWVRKEKRYAVESYWDDDSTWQTVDTLAEVEQLIRERETGCVVDLDTGEEVPFTRTVAVLLAPGQNSNADASQSSGAISVADDTARDLQSAVSVEEIKPVKDGVS